MCGIAGYVDFDSVVDSNLLRRMTDSIYYRGPDSSGSYFDKHVALGIRRLSIIDLVTGDQPIANEDGGVSVVFNGEIYNYKSLKEELLKDGHIFKTTSDTEVLVHLYEKYGVKIVSRLNGMFAFAIWDKNKQSLFIARDRLGIKPLYYYKTAKRFVFGSEVKTILMDENVKTSLDSTSLTYYSYLGYIPTFRSMFKDVFKLLPGHFLVFSKKGLRIEKYYEPIFENSNYGSRELEDRMERAVVGQSIADVPLGVFLSGGTDSSLVSYYLAKNRKRLKTFSIGFKEKSFNESSFARTASKIIGSEHYEDVMGAKDVIESFDDICSKLDEPFADPSLFPTYKVCKFARRYVKVVLSGDGGDELFGGYPTYQAHLFAEKLKFLPSRIFDLGIFVASLLPNSYENYAPRDVLTMFLTGVKKNDFGRHLHWMSMFSLYNKSLFKVDVKKIKSELGLRLSGGITRRMQLLDIATYLRDNMLFKVDRASMFNSLEVRVPLLDNSLLEYAMNIRNPHVDYFSTKKLFRQLMIGKFPDTMVKRKKKGFGIPVAQWICRDLNKFAYERLNNQSLWQFFDKKKVKSLWDDHQARRRNNYKSLWMLIMFSGWLWKWGNKI